MPVIQFRTNAAIEQVEDFPKGCGRTEEGAFHVRPGATRVVTSAELAHLQKRGCRLTVIRQADAPPKAPDKAPDAAAELPPPNDTDATSEPETAPETASVGGKGGKRGKRDKK